jgi:hypothetical protein
MACAFCGAMLTIPENLRTKEMPKVEKIPPKPDPFQKLEKEAPNLLRKAEPIAIGAWNLYAVWTWLRWLIPTCLTIAVIGFFICLALGLLPVVIRALR